MVPYMDVPLGDDDNETIRVEISSNQGLVRAATPGDVVGRATQRFDEAVAQVVKMGENAILKAKAAAHRPDAVELELGLKVTAKTGFVVAESSGEANVKVVLKWALGEAGSPPAGLPNG